jgi:hypothetical protein
MKADIDVTMSYPYPADRVWAALTSSERPMTGVREEWR